MSETPPLVDAPLDADVRAKIDALRTAGRFGEAGYVALAEGAPGRASELYAEAWDFARAVEVARGAGLLELAYRHALSGNLRHESQQLVAELADHPEEAARAAVHAEQKGHLADAARMLEHAADIDGPPRCTSEAVSSSTRRAAERRKAAIATRACSTSGV